MKSYENTPTSETPIDISYEWTEEDERDVTRYSMQRAATSMEEEETDTLPDGWQWVKLGEVCRIVSGSTPDSSNPSYWEGDIVWITPTDLGKMEGFVIEASARKITPAGYASCSTEMVPVGSVVMSSRAPIGHLGIAYVPLCTNQGCKTFIPRDDVVSEFLYYALKISVPTLRELGSGATFAEISKTQLANYEIPLPPLPEQQRIAARLTAQMGAVAQARRAAIAQLATVKELPAAYLREVFEGAEAKQVRLGDICTITMGQSPEGTTYNSESIGLPLLNGPTEFGIVHPTPAQWTTSPKKFARVGDILLCVRGATTGRKNIADQQYCIGRGLAAIRGKSGQATTEYISYALDALTATLLQQTSGSTFPNLPGAKLEGMTIPLPPLEEQQRIVARLAEQMEAVRQAQKAAQAQLDALDQLPAALLREAFAGRI